jgi:hypothetical protein
MEKLTQTRVGNMINSASLQTLFGVMKTMTATERLVADFYRTCAETWKEDREFWMGIVEEEEKHARNIERMTQIIASRPGRFEIGRPFNETAIRTTMKGIEGFMERMKSGKVTRKGAFFMARDIENSVIEKNYAEIVRTDDLEYLTLLKEVVEDTGTHKHEIEERIREIKK